jgi:uncharacterized membrane protein YsdA (DUF1294 family)
MSTILLLWVLAWNILAFALMGIDKAKARGNAWRIPERTLFLAAILGGSVGAIFGMSFFHHKTKHWYFQLGMPAILILQIIVALVITWRFVL